MLEGNAKEKEVLHLVPSPAPPSVLISRSLDQEGFLVRQVMRQLKNKPPLVTRYLSFLFITLKPRVE